jgi:hypothetical protein
MSRFSSLPVNTARAGADAVQRSTAKRSRSVVLKFVQFIERLAQAATGSAGLAGSTRPL